MKVKWLGHSCFLVISKGGVRIITDPYAVGGGINYSPIKETADIVVVTHGHDDHSNVSAVQGEPEVVRGDGTKTARGIQFRGVASSHDDSHGAQRGPNTIFCFTIDDINLCHLGDLGHVLSPGQVNEIMHFKTPKCAYPIAGVEDFLKGKKNVRRVGDSEAEFEGERLPVATEIVLLQPAL
jgi:L-ascorbate metabolism protein UlaG (beta-lactamase superfamily)